MTTNRVSPGVPEGGQFAAQQRTESPISLTLPTTEIGDLRLGAAVENGIITAAASGGHALFVGNTTDRASLNKIGETLGAISGKHVVVADHTTSALGFIGNIDREGLAAQANGGILVILDAAEVSPVALDALRQPLESGYSIVHRAAKSVTREADFQLVLISAPCPCGNYGSTTAECTCTPFARRHYLSRLSGPLLDRVDIQARATAADGEPQPTNDEAAARNAAAAERTTAKLQGTPWRKWTQVPGPWLRSNENRLANDVSAPIDRALERGALTMRGYDRVLRVAWSLAMLDDEPRPTVDHVTRALAARKLAS